MEEIKAALMNRYGLETDGIESFMDGYMIHTGNTEKYARKNFFSAGRVIFIHGAKEHLAKKGFVNTDRFITTLEGEPFMVLRDTLYTLTDRFNGRECDFYKIEDLFFAIRVIAQMHCKSTGYPGFWENTGEKSSYCPLKETAATMPESQPGMAMNTAVVPIVRSNLGKLPGIYRKKLRELKKLRNYARRMKTAFDSIYMDVVDKFCAQGEAALKKIDGDAYRRLVEKAQKDRVFCHGNLSHKNIIFGENGLHIRGFENCRYDIRVSDLVDFIRRRLRKCNWSADDAAAIVNEYSCVDPLSKDELEVVKGMLQFPYRFWELSNRFYNSKKSWAEKVYTPKLKELVKNIEKIDDFVNRLDRALC